jgi:hypothetical protein
VFPASKADIALSHRRLLNETSNRAPHSLCPRDLLLFAKASESGDLFFR